MTYGNFDHLRWGLKARKAHRDYLAGHMTMAEYNQVAIASRFINQDPATLIGYVLHA